MLTKCRLQSPASNPSAHLQVWRCLCGKRTALHGFFVGMQAPLPNLWNWFGQSISYLVLAVVVRKLLAAQAYKQSELS